jgi:hypothetical protein
LSEGIGVSGKLKVLFKKDRFTLFFWIGAILLVIGLGTWWYADSVVRGHEEVLNYNLSPEERAQVSGSLTWWRIAQITLYTPLSFILITIGIICIVYAFVWMVMQPIKVVSETK